jgi:hypothetical protein
MKRHIKTKKRYQFKDSILRYKSIKLKVLPVLIFITIFSAFKWGWPILILTKFFPNQSTENLFDWFNNWQSDSDALVTGRLLQNYTTGAFSYFGLLGSQGSYLSQFGFGSNILTLVPFYIGVPFEYGLTLIKIIVIFINSIFWTILGFFLYKKFGYFSLFFFLIGLFQPWSLVANKSTYWFISLKLYPMIFLYFVQKKSISTYKIRFNKFLYVLSLSVSILSGYEFLTVTLAVLLAVFFYSQLEGGELRRNQILNFTKMGMTLLCTILFSLFLHFFQLVLFLGNTKLSLNYLFSRLNGRILGDLNSSESGIAASASISPKFVLGKYLEMPIFGSPANLLNFRYFTILIFICLFLAFFLFSQVRNNLDKRLERNLEIRNAVIFVFLTLMGPVFWYLFAAPHSFIHFHINFILWYLPFIPLAFGLIPAMYR